ncbi:unnamed protein product [Ectocarpus sp. 12 AP-2014]
MHVSKLHGKAAPAADREESVFRSYTAKRAFLAPAADREESLFRNYTELVLM